uniref:Uncharacterized protein n=1 Tax=Tetraselmis sp. GSL018 TaxID=582737 RepID=A0A061SC14_9CHLO
MGQWVRAWARCARSSRSCPFASHQNADIGDVKYQETSFESLLGYLLNRKQRCRTSRENRAMQICSGESHSSSTRDVLINICCSACQLSQTIGGTPRVTSKTNSYE